MSNAADPSVAAAFARFQDLDPAPGRLTRKDFRIFPGGIVMLRQAKVAVSFVLVAISLMMEGTLDANASSKLPDPIKAGVAEKLFRLDCGRSLANDESVWTPGENVGRSIEFSS